MQNSLVSTRIIKSIGGLAVSLSIMAAALTTPVTADEISDWRKKVIKKIVKKHIYPRSAISREIEGKARVRVTLDRSGAITNYEVVEPSGQAILDKAIPKMIKKMDPLPTPPDSLPDANLTFVIPITWRLQ